MSSLTVTMTKDDLARLDAVAEASEGTRESVALEAIRSLSPPKKKAAKKGKE